MFPKYDELKARAQRLIANGKLSSAPTREQRIDIAYGNARIENADFTHAMVVDAVDAEQS